jgi:hypothetical protein
MNFLRIFWRGGAGTCFVALRNQADTLFYAIEPCITGMTPSVRRPLLRAGGRTNEDFRGLDKEADAIFQARGTAWTSQKHDGPPKRAV